MKKKNKIIIAIASIVVIGLLFLVFYRPVSVESSYIRFDPIRSQEQFDEIKNYTERNRGSEGYQYLREIDSLGSDSYEDYCYVYIDFVLKNNSPFYVSVHDSYVADSDKADFVIFKQPAVASTSLWRFGKAMNENGCFILCYRGDLSDEQLLEKVKKLQIKLLYDSGASVKTRLTDAEFVSSFKEFDRIRSEIQRG